MVRPLVFGHRGARSAAPENTIEAFRMARHLGADGVEMDVRRTGDNALIVVHDPVIGPDDIPVIELTRREVSKIAPDIPDLDEALGACEGLVVDLEVKNNPAEPDWDPNDDTVSAVIDVVSSTRIEDRCFISSFNLPTVMAARDAGVDAGWLLPRSLAILDAAREWPTDIDLALPSAESVVAAGLEQITTAFADLGVAVGVWTVNDPEDIRRFARGGVSYLFTDDVAMAVKALGR